MNAARAVVGAGLILGVLAFIAVAEVTRYRSAVSAVTVAVAIIATGYLIAAQMGGAL